MLDDGSGANQKVITEIWSGGQTGVDQAALETARKCGVPTHGWMPKGFLTEDGPRPDLGTLFGLRETSSAHYPERTKRNAKDTDGTVWIEGPGDVTKDHGYVTTAKGANLHAKPFLRIHRVASHEQAAALIAIWVVVKDIKTLNVAGPRVSRWAGGYERTCLILGRLLGSDRE